MPEGRQSRSAHIRCGEWRSPISAALIAEGGVRLAQPCSDGERIYWLETRPTEQGRTVLMRAARGAPAVEVSPAELSVRSRAHEYGGGAYAVGGGYAWFVGETDQCLYQITGLDRCRQITRAEAARYADLEPDLRRRRLICVQELHAGGEPLNRLVAVDLASGVVRLLFDQADFVSSPRLSEDGQRLAWVAWRHPNLPWDETELWVAQLGDDGRLRGARRLPGPRGVSLGQPRWGANGMLYFVSDQSDWWSLYRWNGSQTEPLAQIEADFALPQWNFGMSTYGFVAADTLLCAWTRDARWYLGSLNLADRRLRRLATTYDAIEHLDARAGLAVMLAGSAREAPAVVAIEPRLAAFSVVRRSREQRIGAGYLSIPRSLDFQTGAEETAHALFYPPANQDQHVASDEQPPLLVRCHGGPTSATSTMQNLRVQFWTSRGFAVLDVNYRGSTGYGRSYRHKLYGQWGIADVADCVAGARHVCAQGWADAARAVISGSSAGGYVVLCALAFHDFFAAGASYFGIGDLRAMFAETHKFESHYDHWLIGPREDRDRLAAERSPAVHAAAIDRPVILFQGLEDRVVPPGQSERLAALLAGNGVPVCYLPFTGEAHGFRRAETIRCSLEAELTFYARVLGFSPADPLPPLAIENLPP